MIRGLMDGPEAGIVAGIMPKRIHWEGRLETRSVGSRGITAARRHPGGGPDCRV